MSKPSISNHSPVRPIIIGGQRDEFRLAEGILLQLAHFVGPILPKTFRIRPPSISPTRSWMLLSRSS
jgi:hypothetical protein